MEVKIGLYVVVLTNKCVVNLTKECNSNVKELLPPLFFINLSLGGFGKAQISIFSDLLLEHHFSVCQFLLVINSISPCLLVFSSFLFISTFLTWQFRPLTLYPSIIAAASQQILQLQFLFPAPKSSLCPMQFPPNPQQCASPKPSVLYIGTHLSYRESLGSQAPSHSLTQSYSSRYNSRGPIW